MYMFGIGPMINRMIIAETNSSTISTPAMTPITGTQDEIASVTRRNAIWNPAPGKSSSANKKHSSIHTNRK